MIVLEKSTIDKQAWIVVISDQQIFLLDDGAQYFLNYEQAHTIMPNILDTGTVHYVGEYQGKNTYTVTLAVCFESEKGQWFGLRDSLKNKDEETYQLISRARQLITWNNQHQYCGQCGKKTAVHHSESALFCSPCKIFYYPKISPCMMCLVTRGDECLLAYHHKYQHVMYSTLAGFVEAGESVETTVHREVMEEVGLTVGKLQYYASQSWPFPHQLMVGYFAQYDSGDICIDDDELADAKWFHYNDLPTIPPEETLSGQMIRAFVAQRNNIHS